MPARVLAMWIVACALRSGTMALVRAAPPGGPRFVNAQPSATWRERDCQCLEAASRTCVCVGI